MPFRTIVLYLSVLFPAIVSGQALNSPDTLKKGAYSTKYFEKNCIGNIQGGNIHGLAENVNNWLQFNRNEAPERLNVLLQINNNALNIPEEENLIRNLCIYKALKNGYRNADTVYFLPYRYITGYPDVDESFHHATENFARQILNEGKAEKEDKILLGFYAGEIDSVFAEIQKQPDNSVLNKAYQEYVNDIIKDSFGVKFGILTGLWVPTGNLEKLGHHPSLGFQMGGYGKNGWGITLSMMQRYKHAKDPLNINFGEEILRTEKYLGGFYGLDVSKCFFSNIKNEFELMAGIALDGFLSTYDYPDEGTYIEKYINSFNFNAGIAYRYVIHQSYFIEWQLRYNIINYENAGGDDLSGNALSVHLNIGFFSGGRTRRDILRYLDYKY